MYVQRVCLGHIDPSILLEIGKKYLQKHAKRFQFNQAVEKLYSYEVIFFLEIFLILLSKNIFRVILTKVQQAIRETIRKSLKVG